MAFKIKVNWSKHGFSKFDFLFPKKRPKRPNETHVVKFTNVYVIPSTDPNPEPVIMTNQEIYDTFAYNYCYNWIEMIHDARMLISIDDVTFDMKNPEKDVKKFKQIVGIAPQITMVMY